jgi:tetratricopeptide (TPR) repeat protein
MTLNRLHCAIVAIAVWLLPLLAAAQTRDDRVRQLYAAAEYEQALEAIGAAADAPAEQYRALCLLALGRTAAAEASVVTLVSAFPDFAVSDTDAPPRFVAMVGRVRNELLPTILRRHFAEARELFQAKAYDQALPLFERVMELSAGPEARQVEGVEDLRLLAAGFIDLAKAPREVPRDATPAAATEASARAASPPTVTPPVARRQVVPPWPEEAGRLVFQRVGSVRVQVSDTGRVTGSTMIKSIHPAYDRRLLAAAMDWEYIPASLDGVPVESESTTEIRVTVPPQ